MHTAQGNLNNPVVYYFHKYVSYILPIKRGSITFEMSLGMESKHLLEKICALIVCFSVNLMHISNTHWAQLNPQTEISHNV